MESSRRAAVLTAVIATVVVFAYAAVAVTQILVLNPLAAVPGSTLDQIHAGLAAAGESLGTPMVILFMSIGPIGALALLILTLRGPAVPPRIVAVSYLMLLAIGAGAYWIASFGAGMALADTFSINGGDYSPWAWPLYVVSLLAAAALVAIAVGNRFQR